MALVPCTGKKCRGAIHSEDCERFIEAVLKMEIKPAQRKNNSGKPRPKDALPLTDAERAEIARRNGMHGGRPPGSGSPFPLATAEALRKAKLRVKKMEGVTPEEQKAIEDASGYTLHRLMQVIGGRLSTGKAPSILKGIIQFREEFCEPVEKVSTIKGQVDFGAVLDAVDKKVQ
jgi:hypothetical protein